MRTVSRAGLVAAGLVASLAAAPGGNGVHARVVQDEKGSIIGQVELPEDLSEQAVVQVLLMAPEWASEWMSDVQERLRVYSSTNAPAIERDPSLFDRIAYRARREATAYVAAQMQGNLGVEAFERWVGDVAGDGTFEFEGLEFGEYQVIVVAQAESGGYLWSRPARVSGSLPQFVDMGPYFR